MSARRRRQGVLLVFVVGPLLATAYAMYSLWNEWISWRELILFFALYLLTGLGITIGFHRMLTHHSFATNPVIKAFFLILGSMAVEGHAIDWAANPLKHRSMASSTRTSAGSSGSNQPSGNDMPSDCSMTRSSSSSIRRFSSGSRSATSFPT
jgi:fatty-acid desaturase